MTTELRFLVASVVLGLVHLIASSHLISWQRGYRWTAGSREGQSPPLSGVANRVDQATTNFLETFPFFVAVVFVAGVPGHHSLLTMLGAHFYFWVALVISCRRCWIQLGSFGAVLEHRTDRYSAFCCRPVMGAFHQLRLTLR